MSVPFHYRFLVVFITITGWLLKSASLSDLVGHFRIVRTEGSSVFILILTPLRPVFEIFSFHFFGAVSSDFGRSYLNRRSYRWFTLVDKVFADHGTLN
jgi:hypothetical protein